MELYSSGVVAVAEGATEIFTINIPISEDSYLWQVYLRIGTVEKSIFEASCNLRLIPGLTSSIIFEHSIHKHGHQHIPLGQDTQLTAPYNDEAKLIFPYELMPFLEKGDALQFDGGWTNVGSLGLGAMNAESLAFIYFLVKG